MEINNAQDLEAAIKRLTHKKDLQKDMVIDQFHEVTDSLKPINLLKSSLNKVVHAPGLVEKIINATLGLGAGVLSKKLLIGKSAGVAKKLLGTALEFGVAGLISKNSETIKNKGVDFFSKIFTKKKKLLI